MAIYKTTTSSSLLTIVIWSLEKKHLIAENKMVKIVAFVLLAFTFIGFAVDAKSPTTTV